MSAGRHPGSRAARTPTATASAPAQPADTTTTTPARSPRTAAISPTGRTSSPTPRRELTGADLACWCPVEKTCHADLLLQIVAAE
jgi:hypothetical protein